MKRAHVTTSAYDVQYPYSDDMNKQLASAGNGLSDNAIMALFNHGDPSKSMQGRERQTQRQFKTLPDTIELELQLPTEVIGLGLRNKEWINADDVMPLFPTDALTISWRTVMVTTPAADQVPTLSTVRRITRSETAKSISTVRYGLGFMCELDRSASPPPPPGD